MTRYKLHGDNIVIKNGHMCIPFDNLNRDYQEYLEWLEAGNLPEPADPIIDYVGIPTQEERLQALELVVSMVFGEDDADV